MGKARLEAFSHGVIAVIITIMVLEMKVPHGDDLAALQSLLPVLNSYALSFVYVGIYGAVLFMSAVAYYILSRTLIKHDGRDSAIATALGGDFKGKISLAIYAAAIPLSFVNRWLAVGLYVFVAAMWFVPDRRIEAVLDR